MSDLRTGDSRDPSYAPRMRPGPVGRRPTVGTDGRPVPRGVHPETWRLSETLLAARRRLPYASGEARLLDGVQRFVQLDARVPVDGVSLTPTGPRWAAVMRLLAAVAPLVSEDSRRMLAPWLGPATPGAPGQAAVGVSPHAGAAAAFAARSLRKADGGCDHGDSPCSERDPFCAVGFGGGAYGPAEEAS